MEVLKQFETYIAAQKAMGIQFIILGLLILESKVHFFPLGQKLP
jgi:hypothetical protein